MNIKCLNCGRPYPEAGQPYVCPVCGGIFDVSEPWSFGEIDKSEIGIWKFRSSFGFDTEPISLGEGSTPLISARAFGRQVYFKCEYTNPTGSFKDRGIATLTAFMKSRGVTEAVEDSSGNAGASFAAYAARAGIQASVYLPESASGPKRKQIEMYGAKLIPINGPRSAAADAVRKAADSGQAYASHAFSPFVFPGYATCAYEIVEQLGRAPAIVVLPAGQGGLLLGLGRGFQALLRAGKIDKMPVLIGVQASACAPLTALFSMGLVGMNFVTEGATLAEGVRVRTPLRAEAVIKMVQESRGRLVAVEEAAILPGRDALARLGFYVEPTSALVWPVLEQILPDLPDPVVSILTGSGYKFQM